MRVPYLFEFALAAFIFLLARYSGIHVQFRDGSPHPSTHIHIQILEQEHHLLRTAYGETGMRPFRRGLCLSDLSGKPSTPLPAGVQLRRTSPLLSGSGTSQVCPGDESGRVVLKSLCKGATSLLNSYIAARVCGRVHDDPAAQVYGVPEGYRYDLFHGPLYTPEV